MFIDNTKVEFSAARLKMRNLERAPIRPLANQISQMVLSQVQHRFLHEKKDSKGVPWKPWSESYRRRINGRGSLLVQSGKLWKSYYGGVSNVAGNTAKIFVESNLIYAGAHEDSQRAWLPRRKVLGISTKNRKDIVNLMKSYFSEIIDGR